MGSVTGGVATSRILYKYAASPTNDEGQGIESYADGSMLKTEQRRPRAKKKKRKLRRLVEFQGARKDAVTVRDTVQRHYDGPAGAVLSVASLVSLHEPLVGHLLRSGKFDVRRFNSILDVGAGAGQILGHLVKLSRPEARLVAFDLSHEMLRRARPRIRSNRPAYVSGDMTSMPFADETFDCITCGLVLEHLPDPAPGLAEFARVLQPGGSVLLLVTEDTLQGAFTSRTWKCRTFNRGELEDACNTAGLQWQEQFWFTPLHKLFKAGGILVEATKVRAP